MRNLKIRMIYVIVAFIFGCIYSFLTGSKNNPGVMVIAISIFPILFYFVTILKKCGATGKKIIFLEIGIPLILPIIFYFLSLISRIIGCDSIGANLFRIRFIPLFLAIFGFSIDLVTKNKSEVLLWLSGFAERYKD